MDKEPPYYESDLIEVGALPLSDVLVLGETVLGRALQRLLHEADHPEEVLAGWQSGF
jgi:FXSXX-COOH protein